MTPAGTHEPDPALVAFCELEQPKLIGVLTLYCGNKALGEELAQEALARACLRWKQLKDMASPQAWVHRVAINLANSHFRRAAAERRARRRQAAQSSQASPSAETTDAVAVRDAVASLPRRQRAALVLRYFADLPVTEVAELMDCPDNTVKTLTRRALQRLGSDLQEPELKEASDVR